MTAALWRALGDSLSRLAEDGRPIRFWLRDDDAVAPSATLDRLIAVAGEVPLALAVIPALAEPALAGRLAECPRVSVLQHGYAHTDHSAPAAKKCELGPERPAATVLGELAAGRDRLGIFTRVVPVLVPPWNRIAEDIVAGLPALGFRALSVYGERPVSRAGLPRLNTHIDPVDWHGGRAFLGEDVVLASLIARLERLRTGAAERDEPTGILTHHLVHDAASFAFLANLLPAIADHPACRWQSVETLLGLDALSQSAGAT